MEKHQQSTMKEKFEQNWQDKTVFERFEYVVLMIVSFLLALIILVALERLMVNVYHLIITSLNKNVEFKTIQITFGMLLTLLIAFEFKNSINAIVEGNGLLVQVKIVILIAMIALARKFLVLDSKEIEPAAIAAYAAVMLTLGIVYWLLGKDQNKTI